MALITILHFLTASLLIICDIIRFIPITIDACLKNKNFDTSDGIQKRDFLFIDDLISLIIKALLSKFSSGKIFNAGSGNPRVLKSITNRIIKESGGGLANYGKIKLRKDEVLNVYPSIVKAKKILRWKHDFNFKDLVKDMVSEDLKFVEKECY